jgi:hypothetical protein
MGFRLIAIGTALWMAAAAPAGAGESGPLPGTADSGRPPAEESQHVAKNEAEKSATALPASASQEVQTARDSSLTVYVPPSNRGAVGARTGGGSRGSANH